MNHSTITYLLILFASSSIVAACPTCVGKVQQNSPPFFADEFYVSYDDNFDEEFTITGTGS